MNPAIFGPPIWVTLFYLTYRVKDISDRRLIGQLLVLLQKLLPCELCREHLKENMAKYRYENFISSNENIFYYLYFLKKLADSSKKGYVAPPLKAVQLKYARMSDEVFISALWKSIKYMSIECEHSNELIDFIIIVAVLCPFEYIDKGVTNFTERYSLSDFRNPEEYFDNLINYVESNLY